jgi:hypothetical protein
VYTHALSQPPQHGSQQLAIAQAFKPPPVFELRVEKVNGYCIQYGPLSAKGFVARNEFLLARQYDAITLPECFEFNKSIRGQMNL